MDLPQLNWIANFIRGIADDVLRDLHVRGKYRDTCHDIGIHFLVGALALENEAKGFWRRSSAKMRHEWQ
ncbi:MAG: hypothetical protein ACREVE_05705 [Gammaproteobacteria bacterium]